VDLTLSQTTFHSQGIEAMTFVSALAAKACCAAALLFLTLWASPSFAQAPQFVCGQIASLTANGLVAGNTNGIFGILRAGETVTMAATLGTATAGTFRIVGDPAGAVTLAGPASIPGTLTYGGTGGFPPGAVGVGYFIDTATGGNVNIRASCAAGAVPTTSQTTLMAMAALLLILGVGVLYRRRGG
jgi:hypothetical protein